jgi:predicted DNA-binding transcriptional regulator AlpA
LSLYKCPAEGGNYTVEYPNLPDQDEFAGKCAQTVYLDIPRSSGDVLPKQGIFQMSTPRLINVEATLERTGLGKTSLYERIKAREFRPIKLGRRTFFPEEEVTDWVNARIAARG